MTKKSEYRRGMNARAVLATINKKASKKKTRGKKVAKRRRGPVITKSKFQKAIIGSHGIISRIAERLDVSRQYIPALLKREGWEDLAEVYRNECEFVGDIAETALIEAMQQRLDLRTATDVAKWYLTKIHAKRGYTDKKTVVMEGGETPLKVEQAIDISTLNLSLETRRQILAAIEAQEKDGEKENG